MKSKKEKAQIIRAIMDRYYVGLPKAIDIYNYLSCYGELSITINDLKNEE